MTTDTIKKQANGTRERFSQLQQRQRVVEQLADAFTRPEVDHALSEQRKYLEQYPIDRGLEIYHGFEYTVFFLEEREDDAKAIGLTLDEHTEREQLFKTLYQSLDGRNYLEASDRARLDAAIYRLTAWGERFPQDTYTAKIRQQWQTEYETYAKLAEEMENEPVPAGSERVFA